MPGDRWLPGNHWLRKTRLKRKPPLGWQGNRQEPLHYSCRPNQLGQHPQCQHRLTCRLETPLRHPEEEIGLGYRGKQLGFAPEDTPGWLMGQQKPGKRRLPLHQGEHRIGLPEASKAQFLRRERPQCGTDRLPQTDRAVPDGWPAIGLAAKDWQGGLNWLWLKAVPAPGHGPPRGCRQHRPLRPEVPLG